MIVFSLREDNQECKFQNQGTAMPKTYHYPMLYYLIPKNLVVNPESASWPLNNACKQPNLHAFL
ncbi:MAG: hypothetical protein VYE44_03515, partial [Verrucomicrobiota bacterium]|nr:hypothetical protein [Verrucomicrobiota bacterium]